jgi:predicted Kef-type K+ transport protein
MLNRFGFEFNLNNSTADFAKAVIAFVVLGKIVFYCLEWLCVNKLPIGEVLFCASSLFHIRAMQKRMHNNAENDRLLRPRLFRLSDIFSHAK